MPALTDRYLTRADVSLRLHGGIVKYAGDYYFASVTSDEAPHIVLSAVYKGQKSEHLDKEVDANSELLDVSSPALGWFKATSESWVFAVRGPWRRQKQAISRDNLSYYINPTDAGSHGIGSFLGTKGFYDMLVGNYPSFEKALSEDSCAVSREFYKLGNRFFSNLREVGRVSEGRVELYPQYDHSLIRMRLAENGVLT